MIANVDDVALSFSHSSYVPPPSIVGITQKNYYHAALRSQTIYHSHMHSIEALLRVVSPSSISLSLSPPKKFHESGGTNKRIQYQTLYLHRHTHSLYMYLLLMMTSAPLPIPTHVLIVFLLLLFFNKH